MLIGLLDDRDLYCSQSSACTTARPTPSYVLTAMGLSETEAYASLRFSFGVLNTVKKPSARRSASSTPYRDLHHRLHRIGGVAMRFGGHQTFFVREGWLAKGLALLREDASGVRRHPYVADQLGVGRNMAKSIEHWLLATGLAEKTERRGRGRSGQPRLKVTELGEVVSLHDPVVSRSRHLVVHAYQPGAHTGARGNMALVLQPRTHRAGSNVRRWSHSSNSMSA